MIGPGGGITIRFKALKAEEANTDKGQIANHENIGIVAQLKATERHWKRIRVVDLKPIIARSRIGHPFVNAQAGANAQRLSDVRGAASREREHPIAAAAGDAAH